MTTKLEIQCRIDEETIIGKFLYDSLSSNLAAFTAFSPIYNAAFLTNMDAKLTALKALLNPKKITSEQKVITGRINGNMDSLRGKLDFVEGYIKRATGLTIAAKDFGVSAVRQKNNKGDVEGLIGALNYLMVNVTNNMAALVTVGYTPAQNTALVNINTALFNDNAAQNVKINERNNLVEANYGLFNDFWKICTDVSDAGKRIFKSSAKNKMDDFTVAELKRRIRQEQKKNKITGKITASETEPPSGDLTGIARIKFAGVKVELIPVAGGRRRVTTSDAKGNYEIKSLTEGEYIANFTNAEANSKSSDIVIETGKTTTTNINMVAKAGSELAKIVKKSGAVS